MARILLVEDDPDVRPILEHILDADGYHVSATETAANARKLLAAEAFDLLVTDARLRDGNGIELADAAERQGIGSIVITGYGLSLPAEDLLRHDYILKPFRPAELLQALRRKLEAVQSAGPSASTAPLRKDESAC